MEREICDELMRDLEGEFEKAVTRAAKATEARIKVWILASLASVLLLVIGTVFYVGSTFGSTSSEVIHNSNQIQDLRKDVDQGLHDIKTQVDWLNQLHMGGRTP